MYFGLYDVHNYNNIWDKCPFLFNQRLFSQSEQCAVNYLFTMNWFPPVLVRESSSSWFSVVPSFGCCEHYSQLIHIFRISVIFIRNTLLDGLVVVLLGPGFKCRVLFHGGDQEKALPTKPCYACLQHTGGTAYCYNHYQQAI